MTGRKSEQRYIKAVVPPQHHVLMPPRQLQLDIVVQIIHHRGQTLVGVNIAVIDNSDDWVRCSSEKIDPQQVIGLKTNRKKLKDKGLLDELDADFYQLNDDTEFRSASGAAAVVVGGNMNGLTTWKYNGQTLADFEKNINKSDS